ncbi:hypothetical protein [Hyphomicrobium sp. 2TAF46]|uniref:hypothetical protein n=1 Tax=Hyphomicrobium sp. 2TAF46 TaxID=3233019 RepID=UPI003F920E9D
MAELERPGAVEAPHERGNARPVLCRQLPDMGAIDRFVREVCRQTIDGLMQIHNQDMKAVALATLAAGQLLQLIGIEGARGKLTEPIAPPVDSTEKLMMGAVIIAL